MNGCEHVWVFGGLRYQSDQGYAGSYRRTKYWDWFYCQKCLASEHLNERLVGTYDSLPPGAIPR